MKFLKPNLQAYPLLFSWHGVVSDYFDCHKTQPPRFSVWLAQEFSMRQREWQLVYQVESSQGRLCSSWLHADVSSSNSPIRAVSYTMFSAPGRGPCGGPWSCLLCNWASCSTGMLHKGHTFRTSSHLIRHFLWKACLHGQIPNSSLGLKSSRHTAQSSCKFSSFTFSFNITCL